MQVGSTSAAAICAAYTGGSFNAWYLPSIEELNKMYLNIGQGNALGLGNIGGFADYYYWSSTEVDNSDAWQQNFSNGYQSTNTLRATSAMLGLFGLFNHLTI